MLFFVILILFVFMLFVVMFLNIFVFFYGYLKVIDMVGDIYIYVKLKIFVIEYELLNWIM